MSIKKTFNGFPILAPVPPVMVSCGSMESSNIITIAWTGIICSDPPMTYISIRPERFSYDIINKSKEFVINLVPSSLIRKTDFIGTYSGRKIDKFQETGLTKEKASFIDAPMISECPVNIECIVKDITKLGSHDLFLSEIVKVDVDDSLIDEKGKIHLEKAHLSAYCHGSYYEIGKRIGPRGLSVRKKHTNH